MAANCLVDQFFDAAQFLGRKRLTVREVKTQAVRRDQRAFLLNMLAQNFPQCRMQQMSRGVIERGSGATPPVAAGVHPTADAEFSRLNHTDVSKRCADLLRVFHRKSRRGTDE